MQLLPLRLRAQDNLRGERETTFVQTSSSPAKEEEEAAAPAAPCPLLDTAEIHAIAAVDMCLERLKGGDAGGGGGGGEGEAKKCGKPSLHRHCTYHPSLCNHLISSSPHAQCQGFYSVQVGIVPLKGSAMSRI